MSSIGCVGDGQQEEEASIGLVEMLVDLCVQILPYTTSSRKGHCKVEAVLCKALNPHGYLVVQ